MTTKLLLVAVLVPFIALPQEPGARLLAPSVPMTVRGNLLRHEQRTQMQTTSAWNILLRLSPAERRNCTINVDVGTLASSRAGRLGNTIETLWNSGRYVEALDFLPLLARECDPQEVAVGVRLGSRSAILPEKSAAAGIQVSAVDSIRRVLLQIDRVNDNLCAVLLEHRASGDRWHFVLSTNSGLTWTTTYMWSAPYAMSDISAAVLNGYCYVAYTRGSDRNQVAMHRFRTSDGTQTNFPNGSDAIAVASTTPPEFFWEVALASNQSSGLNNRLYCVALTSGKKVRCLWNVPDTVSWSEITTNIQDAQYGLSAAYNSGGGPPLWISYFGWINQLRIDSVNISPPQCGRAYMKYAGTAYGRTSIAAANDTILCTYNYMITPPASCAFATNVGAGRTAWAEGNVAGGASNQAESPAATLDAGQGMATIYRYQSASGRFVWRRYAGDSWSAPTVYETSGIPENQPSIVKMRGNAYGLLYLIETTQLAGVAYFQSCQSPLNAVAPGLTMPATNVLHQNYPNPFNPVTKIQFTIVDRQSTIVKVYDVLGRGVATLVNELKQPGTYAVDFDGSNLASGVYFYRLQAGDFTQTRRLMLLK